MMIFAVIILQIALVFMLYRLGVRWLQIEERRLAFKQALEKRAEQIAARENPDEEAPVEENYHDLKTISLQTRTLLKLSSFALFFLGLWLTMGDFLPTLHILDRVPLWSTYQSTTDGQILEQITLADIASGLLILGLSLLAAYNLPGLVELLVLDLHHDQEHSTFVWAVGRALGFRRDPPLELFLALALRPQLGELPACGLESRG